MPDPSEQHDFTDWLARYQRGTVNDQMTAGLAELAEQVRALGKAGSLTLKLKMDAKGQGRTVLVTAVVAVDPPKPEPEPSVFYVGDFGRLSRSDPYQGRLADDNGEPIGRATDEEED